MYRSVVSLTVLPRANLTGLFCRSIPKSSPLNLLQPLCGREKSQLLWNQITPASFSKTPVLGVPPTPHPFGISNIHPLFSGRSCILVNAATTHYPLLTTHCPPPTTHYSPSSCLTLLVKKSIAAQRNAALTRSLRWRPVLDADHLDPELRPLRPLVALHISRRSAHRRSPRLARGVQGQGAPLCHHRSGHRDPLRHLRASHAAAARFHKFFLRLRLRPSANGLYRYRRRCC